MDCIQVKCYEIQEFASLLCRGNPTVVDIALHYATISHQFNMKSPAALYESQPWRELIHYILTHPSKTPLARGEHRYVHRLPYFSACFLRQSIGLADCELV